MHKTNDQSKNECISFKSSLAIVEEEKTYSDKDGQGEEKKKEEDMIKFKNDDVVYDNH